MAGSAKLSGRDVQVKVLSVSDVRDVLDEIEERRKEGKQIHMLDLMFNDDVPAVAVAKATGMALKELEGNYDPQEVRDLIDEVRAQNPFFVAMMERLVTVGKDASAKEAQGPSSKPPAP